MKDLIIVATLAVIAVWLALTFSGPLRIVMGLLFIIFFPGYSLVAALFPRKTTLAGIERIALSLGLSLAIVPLIGLLLNYTPWGIRLVPIAFFLLSVILILCTVAAIERKQLPPSERFQVDIEGYIASLTLGWREGGIWDKTLAASLWIAIIVAIATTVYVIQMPTDREDFTEFYILGPDGKAEDYPDALLIGEEGGIILGIVNQEHQNMEYHTVLAIEGEPDQELEQITLEHNEKWEKAISIASSTSGSNRKVEFQLFKEDIDEPYNTIHLWVDIYEMQEELAGQQETTANASST